MPNPGGMVAHNEALVELRARGSAHDGTSPRLPQRVETSQGQRLGRVAGAR
jgi:hypothetical protein